MNFGNKDAKLLIDSIKTYKDIAEHSNKNIDWFETLGILIAVFLASFISTISEYGNEKAFKKLQEQSG